MGFQMISGIYRIAAAAFVIAPAVMLTTMPSSVDAAPAAQSAEYRKCMALRSCRQPYTRCFNRLEKEVKPENWSAEREKCVAAYKVCIDKNFSGGEMLFTRWFVPDENCEQYKK